MSARNSTDLVLLRKTEDGSYEAHTVADPGAFIAVPDDASAWKPWEPKAKKADKET